MLLVAREFSCGLLLYVVIHIGWVECKGSFGGGRSLSGPQSRSSISTARGLTKYSRAYGLTYPSTYYFMYYSYRPTQYIGSPSSASGNGSICRNFDAVENDTYLGIFVCPLPFEPENYMSCCGDKDAQYCCDEKSSSILLIVGIIASIVFVTVVLAAWLLCRFKRAKKIQARIHASTMTEEDSRLAQTSTGQTSPPDAGRLHDRDDVTAHYKPPDVIDFKPPTYEENVEPPPPYSEKVEKS